MFNMINVVGRLVETTMIPPVTEEESRHARETFAHIMRGRAERAVVLADYTGARLLDPAHRQRLTEVLNHWNPDVERSAIFVSPVNPIVLQQFTNIIRKSMHPSRRLFSDAAEVDAWLGEVLNDQERARLRLVLGDRLVAPP